MTSILFKIWLSTLLPLAIFGTEVPSEKHEPILYWLFLGLLTVCILSFIAMVTSLIWMIDI